MWGRVCASTSEPCAFVVGQLGCGCARSNDDLLMCIVHFRDIPALHNGKKAKGADE